MPEEVPPVGVGKEPQACRVEHEEHDSNESGEGPPGGPSKKPQQDQEEEDAGEKVKYEVESAKCLRHYRQGKQSYQAGSKDDREWRKTNVIADSVSIMQQH